MMIVEIDFYGRDQNRHLAMASMDDADRIIIVDNHVWVGSLVIRFVALLIDACSFPLTHYGKHD